uniref:Uncharacterized protein n=1 Tax=Myotis myotis TaxID=51298 RepID=A0A7J7RDJ7_MYOMY|nr:hypothetical protein mMyoMyo1_010383 [Myotis myotis]
MGLEDRCEFVSFLLRVLFGLIPEPHEPLSLAVMDLGLLLPLLLQRGCPAWYSSHPRSQEPRQADSREASDARLEGGGNPIRFPCRRAGDPVRHLEASEAAWPLVLWGHVPRSAARRYGCGLGRAKGHGMGWCLSVCRGRPGTSTCFCRNCQKCDALTEHNHHLVAQQDLLGHDGRQAAQEMASAIEHQALPSAIFGSCLGCLFNCDQSVGQNVSFFKYPFSRLPVRLSIF